MVTSCCSYKRILVNSNRLRENSQLCDIKLLSSDGITFEAHAVILASWSPVLHSIIESREVTPGRTGEMIQVDIPEVTGDVLQMVIQFMYGKAPCSKPSKELLFGLNTLGIAIDKTSGLGASEENVNHTESSPGLGFGGSVWRNEKAVVAPERTRKICPSPVNKVHVTRSSSKARTEENKQQITKTDHNSASFEFFDDSTEQADPGGIKDCTSELKNSTTTETRSTKSSEEDIEGNDENAHIQEKESSQPEKFGRHKHHCDTCDKEFTTLAHFKGHQNVHEGQKPYCCRKCPKTFAYSISLKRHVKKCKGFVAPKEWSCDRCEYLARTYKDYKLHMKGHRRPKFECSQCKQQFVNETRLDSHLRSVHGPGSICPLCGKHVQSQSGFEQHMQTHEKKFRHHCEFCNKGFQNLQHYEGHLNKHKGERPYMCSKCGRSFGYEQAVQSHEKKCCSGKMRIVSRKDDPKCEICGLTFKNNHSLQGHKRGKHGKTPLSCPTCGQQFIWRQSYNRHKTGCKGPPEPEEEQAKVHPCPKCRLRFKHQKSLKEHMQAKHEAPRFLCTECPARFNWKSSYYRHKNSCHPTKTEAPEIQALPQHNTQVPELSQGVVEYEQVAVSENQMEPKFGLIEQCPPQLGAELMQTAALTMGDSASLVVTDLNLGLSDVTPSPLLNSVTQWQYADAFTYQ